MEFWLKNCQSVQIVNIEYQNGLTPAVRTNLKFLGEHFGWRGCRPLLIYLKNVGNGTSYLVNKRTVFFIYKRLVKDMSSISWKP